MPFFKNIRNLVFIILFVSLVYFFYCGGKYLFNFVDNIKLSSINIEGDLKFQPPEQIYSIVSKYTEKSFYSLNLENIKNDLLALPWIDKVYLKRKWISKLQIILDEKKPLAIYNNNAVVTLNADIFYPDSMPEANKLPIFFGKTKFLNEIIKQYQKISPFMLQNGFYIKEFELMSDQGLRILIDRGINLYLGSKDFKERLNNFFISYERRFVGREAKISYIDLRYPNGIAVKFK